MKIRLEQVDRPPVNAEVADDNYGAVRDLLVAYQQHTESDDLVAVNADTGERIARLRFQWLED